MSCPSCGYCSHCGRGGHFYGRPYYTPYYVPGTSGYPQTLTTTNSANAYEDKSLAGKLQAFSNAASACKHEG